MRIVAKKHQKTVRGHRVRHFCFELLPEVANEVFADGQTEVVHKVSLALFLKLSEDCPDVSGIANESRHNITAEDKVPARSCRRVEI